MDELRKKVKLSESTGAKVCDEDENLCCGKELDKVRPFYESRVPRKKNFVLWIKVFLLQQE